MTTIRAYFDGKMFVPEEPVSLPPNTEVTLHVDTDVAPSPELVNDRLKALDALESLAEHSKKGATDWSRDSIYSGTLDDPR